MLEMSRAFNKVIALMAAFCLQAQVFAAHVMPCAHASLPSAQAVMHPCHGGAEPIAADSQSGSAFDCDKCRLATVLSGYDLPASSERPSSYQPVSAPAPARQDHFYRFAPDIPHRPPIALF